MKLSIFQNSKLFPKTLGKPFGVVMLCILLLWQEKAFSQINITHSQGFNGAGANSLGSAGGTIWTYTPSGGSQSSGNNNNPGNPASAPLFSEGTNGWELNNTTNAVETSIITFHNITYAASDIRMVEFRLAGMGKNGDPNPLEGIDPDDYVDVEVSFNAGTTWQHEIRIQLTGTTSNVGYGFNFNSTFSKIANNTLTNVNYLPAWVRVLLPAGNTQVSLKITLRNNNNQERWVIDDVRCGTIPRAPVVADFENASTAPLWTNNDIAIGTNVGIPEGNTTQVGAISTGTNPATGNPASVNLFAPAHPTPPTPHGVQARGFQLDNTTNANAICARLFENVYIKEGNHNYIEFRMAGMGKSAGQGVDNDDFIELQVSVNGGAFTRELRVRGNSQNGWSFASTGVINATYEGDLSPTLYSTPTNAAISISTIRLNLPSWAFQVSARIIMRNNNNQERWVVDNVRLFTDPAPPPAPPIPLTIFAYDGFDYYEDNEEVSGMEFYGPGEKNQTTVASVFPSSDVSIHQFMTSGTRFQTVNSEVSLGWAGDWFVSDPAQQDKYYLGGTNDGSSQILVQNGSYPIACDDQSNNLVNSGLFLQTRSGFPLGVSVGRRLQTSTGGPFFLYYIQGAPLPAGTNPVTSGAVQVHPQSPIVFTNTANPNATPTQHKNQSLEPNPNNRTTTFNTRIGADGSTIWFAVMMRKGASNNNPVFVSLHKHTNVWDTNPNGAIQVGYFGTNGVNPRHWAVRINGTIYYAGTNNTTHPTANNTNTRIQTCEEDTPSGSNYRGDEWDLLVLEIKYNYGPNKLFSAPGDDNHRVRMYVIRDFRRDTHPADPEAGLGGVVQSGANFTQFIANEVNLETGWDIQVTGLQGDLTFHSLAFQGSGGYTGPSGLPSVTDNLYFSDAIDEIRFGASFAAACLYSPTVSLIKGLCEQNGGTSGENIFPEGTFGIAESLTPEGFLATNVTIATQSFEGSGSSVAATGNTGIEWNYTPTLAAANFSAGTNAATGIPASANLYSDGSRGVQLLNNTGALQTLTITTNSIALPKPAGVNNVYVLVDLAGMGNAAGEGVDNTGDQIVLAISTDNGTTYQDEVTIQPSGANVGWNLGGAITNDPAIGTNNTIATNPGRVRIYLPSGATNVSLRITMTNNATNERWVIDNIRLEALNQTAVGEQIATAVGRYNPSENPNAKSRNPAILADSDCPGGNNANCPVVFEDGTALIGTPPVAYNALTGPNYTYVFNQDNRPNDGMYMIANRSGHLFGSNTNNPSWYPVYDNTNKNKNGMLMNVNAAYAKAQFYSKSVGGICGGTQYEFYVDAFNTLRAIRRTVTNPAPTLPAGTTCNKQREPGCQQMSFAGTDATGNSGIGAASEGDFDDTSSQVTSSYHINPELQFLINGKPLYTPPISIPNNSNGNTDHIPADTDGPVQWRRTGFTFVTKPSITNLTVSFRNIAPGGNGNDLNIDNITFRPCGPRSRIRQEIAVPNNYCPSGDNLLLDIGSIGTSTTSRVARWEYSCDGGNTWAPLPPPIPNPMPVTTPYLDLANGYYHGSTTSSVVNIYQLSPASNPNPMVPDPNKPLVNGCMIRVIFAESPDNLNNPKCRFIAGPITINCPNPLLATEIQASAKAQNNGIAVRWYMSQENGMKEYIIERSVDMLNFTPITRFVAKNTGQIYTYIDVIPFEGRNYYRIKGITQNGETKYSNVVSEEWSGKGGINIYPNPTDLGVYVAFSKLFEQREHIKVRLLNTMGIFVMEKDYYLEGTQKTIFIPTENLANGIYLLEIGIGDFKYVSKLVVKH